jgi:hypothetical protein
MLPHRGRGVIQCLPGTIALSQARGVRVQLQQVLTNLMTIEARE